MNATDRPVTSETIGWLRRRLDRDRSRPLETTRDAAGTPDGSVVARLAVDQVPDIASMLKVIDIDEQALADGDDPRFVQIIAWLAHTRSTAPDIWTRGHPTRSIWWRS